MQKKPPISGRPTFVPATSLTDVHFDDEALVVHAESPHDDSLAGQWRFYTNTFKVITLLKMRVDGIFSFKRWQISS